MRKMNLGTGERILRIVIGGALLIWGVLMLYEDGGIIFLLLSIALVALGMDFIVTGIRGYCPLYNRLGWNTAQHKLR